MNPPFFLNERERVWMYTHKKKQKKPRNARENNLFFFVFVFVFSSFPKERFLCARNLCAFCVSFLILSAQHFFFLFFFSILFFSFFLREWRFFLCLSPTSLSFFFFVFFFFVLFFFDLFFSLSLSLSESKPSYITNSLVALD